MRRPARPADLATVELVDERFRHLRRVVESLSPTIADRGLMAYLRNRLASSSQLRDAGEYGAAAYQLRELARKLESLIRHA